MPSKRDLSVAVLRDMNPEERLDAAVLLNVSSKEIFTDEEYVGLYNSIYNTSYTVADRNNEDLENPNVRSHLYMYMMSEKGVSPEELSEMTVDDIKTFVPDFKQAVADHPIYGEAAEKLSKKELEDNIKWYGKMYGTAYKQITDEKFPDANQFSTEAGIATAFHKNSNTFSQVLSTIGYSNNKINYSDIPLKEDMTKDSVSHLLYNTAKEAAGDSGKGSNSIFFKSSRASALSDLLYNVLDPEEDIRTRALNKVILETEIVPDYADKEVRFEDKSMNAMKGEDKIREMLDQVDPTSKGIVFQDFTDEECQKILSTPLKDLKIIEPEIYRKTVIKASEVMPKGKDIRINGMAEEAKKYIAEKKTVSEKALKHREETYKTFENIAQNGQKIAMLADWLPEKNGKIDLTYGYFSSERDNNVGAFDKIFDDALKQQKGIISEQLQSEDKFGRKPLEAVINERFIEGFRVSDPDRPSVTIPVMKAVDKYIDVNRDSNYLKNPHEFAKLLVMFDVKNHKNVFYDPYLYAEDGPKMGKPVRASEDSLEPIQLHVYDLEKIKDNSAQRAIERDKQKNAEHVEQHIRKKKEAEDYRKIAHELKIKEEQYEAEYQRELQAIEDKREIRKRAALKKIKNKKYEEFKKAESAERQTSQMNAAPEPEEDEDEMFRQAEEAYQLMQKELKDKEEAFKKGNKFCIDNLSEEDKKLYDIMDEDREELKRAMEIEKSKKPSKNEVNLPEGAKERHGVSSEIWNGLRESRIGLDENRWFSWTGFGTSHELSRLKHQMDRLLDICNKTNERSYDDKYVRLRDEMVDKLEKEAIAYDREKRGKKHLNDPNWEPITSAGQTRFRANKKILEFCKEYKSKYACKDPKILGNASLSDKVVDVLDDKQWAERLGDIDPERKPTDPKEQKKIIKEVEDCTVGILNAKFSNKFIGKNEISEDAAEMFFDVNSEKIQNADVFKRIKNGLKGKDAWEKAMALKKLAEKDGGVKLIETYSQAVIANKKAKKSAPEAVNAQPQANAVKNKKKPTSTKGGI